MYNWVRLDYKNSDEIEHRQVWGPVPPEICNSADNKFISKVHRIWLKWQNKFFKSLLKWIFVWKKLPYNLGLLYSKSLHRSNKLNSTQNLTVRPFWGNFVHVSLIPWPHLIFLNFFLFCWVCVICAVILKTINLDFMAIKKN